MENKKVVLVTGATRGIGAAIAKQYARKGYTVFGIYNKSIAIAKKLEGKYKNMKLFRVDLGDCDQVKAFVNKLGTNTKALDIIVNNAGVYIGGASRTLKPELLQYSFSVNVMSKFMLTQALLPLLEQSTAPKVINITSRFGFIANADPESIAYNISNSAITMMSLAMQKELESSKVKVGCFVPTVTNTDRFKLAFSAEEKSSIKESGMLASKEDTAMKVIAYAEGLNGKGVLVDRRVSTEHLQCVKIETA